ncbi:MAG: hypothetical protein ABMA26_06215 [Limisphaerales bacterium]
MKSKQKLTILLPTPILVALLELDAQVEVAYQRALRNGTPEPWNPEHPPSIADKLCVLEAYSDRLPAYAREMVRPCCVMTREALMRYDQFVSRYLPIVVSNPPFAAVAEVTGWLATITTTWKLMLHGNRSPGGVSVRIWSSSPPVFLV